MREHTKFNRVALLFIPLHVHKVTAIDKHITAGQITSYERRVCRLPPAVCDLQ